MPIEEILAADRADYARAEKACQVYTPQHLLYVGNVAIRVIVETRAAPVAREEDGALRRIEQVSVIAGDPHIKMQER